jgi:hypothetical protein
VILTDALAATKLRGHDGERALVRVDPNGDHGLLSVGVWSTRDVGAVVVALPTACPAAPCTGDRIVVVGVAQMADRRGRSQPRSPLGVAN